MLSFVLKIKSMKRLKASSGFVFLFSLWSALCLQAQTPSSSVYFELAGSGGLGSFNFEKLLTVKPVIQSGWRVGFSIAPIDRNNGAGIVIPVHFMALIGPGHHQLDLGFGQGLTLTTNGSLFALGNMVVGWRHTFKNKKWFLRVAYTPLISYLIDFQWQHWVGISMGYNLKK